MKKLNIKTTLDKGTPNFIIFYREMVSVQFAYENSEKNMKI